MGLHGSQAVKAAASCSAWKHLVNWLGYEFCFHNFATLKHIYKRKCLIE